MSPRIGVWAMVSAAIRPLSTKGGISYRSQPCPAPRIIDVDRGRCAEQVAPSGLSDYDVRPNRNFPVRHCRHHLEAHRFEDFRYFGFAQIFSAGTVGLVEVA